VGCFPEVDSCFEHANHHPLHLPQQIQLSEVEFGDGDGVVAVVGVHHSDAAAAVVVNEVKSQAKGHLPWNPWVLWVYHPLETRTNLRLQRLLLFPDCWIEMSLDLQLLSHLPD
jgi:hypothetical protein